MTRMVVEVSVRCPAWKTDLPDAPALVEAVLQAAAVAVPLPVCEGAELSVVLADDTFQRELNRAQRGIDRPTNVLSLPLYERAELAEGVPAGSPPAALGDIVLARETVSREAAEQGKAFADHLAHLLVHGFLHLLGYDHREEAEAVDMEALERRILAARGVADPYAPGTTTSLREVTATR